MSVEISENLQSIANSLGLEEQFVEAALHRLSSLDVEIESSDEWMLGFIIQKVQNKIKNYCNTLAIPEELFNVAIDMVAGEFLFTKRGQGKLEGFNVETAIKQIQEGDTNITFVEGQSDSEKMDSLITFLMTNGNNQFISFRRLKW